MCTNIHFSSPFGHVHLLFKHSKGKFNCRNFEFLIPDAPELIATFLEGEQDMSCKRNAFLMLLHADQERALNYLASCLDQVTSFGDILQLVIVELIYKVCHANPSERSRFIRCIYNLLNSNSQAVRYEAAGTLVTLSNAPTAIKVCTSRLDCSKSKTGRRRFINNLS